MTDLRESDLYPPIKAFLEGRGYSVKGEIGDCDVVALRGDEAPIIVEMKLAFALPLVFQGVRRQAITDDVYLAVASPTGKGRANLWRRHFKDIVKLCRRLGLGLMSVDLSNTKTPRVDVHLDPAPYRPRQDKRRRVTLLREFEQRVGDPNQGGVTRRPIVTVYRQDALRCAWHLHRNGPTKAALVKHETGVDRAPTILLRDVYGWFDRVERGIYTLSPKGDGAIVDYAGVIDRLTRDDHMSPS